MAVKFDYNPTRFMLPDSHYSRKKADDAVGFIRALKHVKDPFAGKPFQLLPWQETIIRDVFGVVRPDGTRQFRHVFCEVCKKSGKSELAAAIALFLLCADGEYGAEIYGCANDRKQAVQVFDVAGYMVQDHPTLNKYCKVINSQKRIVFLPSRGFYTAISREVATKFGLNIHGCIFDELLGQTDRKLFDTMTRGAGAARLQPLNFVITTAGSDKTSICYEEHCRAMDILEGRRVDPRFYPVVFCASDDDDWTDPEVWKRVNPSLGHTVPEEYYRETCEQAKHDVGIETHFRQFFLNQWLSVTKRWLPMDLYDKGAKPFAPEDLQGKVCYGGLDLASTADIAAFVLVFPPQDGDEHYYMLPFFWIPRENMEHRVRKDKVPYDRWAKEGYLETTDGNVIYFDYIQKKIEQLSKMYQIKQIMYDEWNARHMAQNLEGMDFEMIEFRQGFRSFTAPTKEFHRLVLDEKLIHGGHPVLRWMCENVHCETDAAGNLKPNKKKSREKIDGAVAAIMGLDGCMRRSEQKWVYMTRGLIVMGDDEARD